VRDCASLYLSVCVTATCIPEFCIHDMVFAITGLEIGCKDNKNELLLISTLQVAYLYFQKWNEATKVAVSDIDFFTCRHREERLHREEWLAWRVQAMVHPQRDTQADRQLLVGNLSPPIQVHTSQVFLDLERQRMCIHIIIIYIYITYIYKK
jgi:hypothetical protein